MKHTIAIVAAIFVLVFVFYTKHVGLSQSDGLVVEMNLTCLMYFINQLQTCMASYHAV